MYIKSLLQSQAQRRDVMPLLLRFPSENDQEKRKEGKPEILSHALISACSFTRA